MTLGLFFLLGSMALGATLLLLGSGRLPAAPYLDLDDIKPQQE